MEAATEVVGLLTANAVAHADPGLRGKHWQVGLRLAITERELLIDMSVPFLEFRHFGQAAGAESGGACCRSADSGRTSLLECPVERTSSKLLFSGPF
ncbi:hypothetical protein [Streptomyces sp. NPDC088246]|uniref:hypothetical protein n=1 Tax=Streptomyces sp. NPDC088246 TaxID=3365842 RepID=UPI00381DC72E